MPRETMVNIIQLLNAMVHFIVYSIAGPLSHLMVNLFIFLLLKCIDHKKKLYKKL